MSVRASAGARAFAGLIAIVSLAALTAQWADLVGRRGMPPLIALAEMARYFTILTHLLVVATFTAIAMAWVRPHTRWLAALTLSIICLSLIYYWLLAGIRDPQGLGYYADLGLHALGPVLVALFWLVAAPKERLRLDHVPGLLTWPLFYLAYALTRGGIESAFPYPFLDPLAIGWTAVAWNVGELALAFLIGGVVLVGLARLFRRAEAMR